MQGQGTRASHVMIWGAATTVPSVGEVNAAISWSKGLGNIPRFPGDYWMTKRFPSQVTLHDRPRVSRASRVSSGAITVNHHLVLSCDILMDIFTQMLCGCSEGTKAERTCWTTVSFVKNLVPQMILKLADWVEELRLGSEPCRTWDWTWAELLRIILYVTCSSPFPEGFLTKYMCSYYVYCVCYVCRYLFLHN